MIDSTMLFFAVIFGGFLGYGLWSGEMPMQFANPTRAKQPALYWFAAAIHGCAITLCLVLAFHLI